MNTLRELEAGVTTKLAILDENGSEKVYKLAIVSKPGWRGEPKILEFRYINDDGFGNITYITGTYSGGITGSGINCRDDNRLEKEYMVETTDLPTIIKMAKGASDQAKAEREEEERRREAAVEELNKLPKEFFHMKCGGVEYSIEFDEFKYEPHRSGYRGSLNTKRNGCDFDVTCYYSKDGVMLKKKIAKNSVFLGGGEDNIGSIMTMLQTLQEKEVEAKAVINSIWNKHLKKA